MKMEVFGESGTAGQGSLKKLQYFSFPKSALFLPQSQCTHLICSVIIGDEDLGCLFFGKGAEGLT